MTIQTFNGTMTQIMREIIKKSDHIDTGSLYESVKFHCTYTDKAGLKIRYDANDYIQYVDGGVIIDMFNNSVKVKRLIEQFYKEKIEEQFKSFSIK